MKVRDLMETLKLELIAGADGLENKINGVYIGDLLSWVMSHLKGGDAWITIQTHANIIAVAMLADAACIVIPENAEIDEQTIEKSNLESIPLLRSRLSAYEIAIKIRELKIVE